MLLRSLKIEETQLKEARMRFDDIRQRIQQLEEKIVQQKNQHQKHLEELTSLDTPIKNKAEEKQRIVNAIQHLEQEEIPLHESQMKEATKQTEQLLSSIQQKQARLDQLNQDITGANEKLNQLKGKQKLTIDILDANHAPV